MEHPIIHMKCVILISFLRLFLILSNIPEENQHCTFVHVDIWAISLGFGTLASSNSLPPGKFFLLFVVCLFFSKSTFSKNSFRNTI